VLVAAADVVASPILDNMRPKKSTSVESEACGLDQDDTYAIAAE
jgi:hypothetical protein